MHLKKSFSLIEVLIFVTILSIILIASATIITASMHQNLLKINMIKAVHYNDQLLEWVRSEKETDWKLFAANAADNIICFEDDAFSWSSGVVDKNHCDATLGGIYRRYVIFNTIYSVGIPTQVEATLYVEWQIGSNNYSSQLHSVFSLWGE